MSDGGNLKKDSLWWLGQVLFVVGTLLFLFSGGCTLLSVGTSLLKGVNWEAILIVLSITIFIGIIGILAGMNIRNWGKRLKAKSDARAQDGKNE